MVYVNLSIYVNFVGPKFELETHINKTFSIFLLQLPKTFDSVNVVLYNFKLQVSFVSEFLKNIIKMTITPINKVELNIYQCDHWESYDMYEMEYLSDRENDDEQEIFEAEEDDWDAEPMEAQAEEDWDTEPIEPQEAEKWDTDTQTDQQKSSSDIVTKWIQIINFIKNHCESKSSWILCNNNFKFVPS